MPREHRYYVYLLTNRNNKVMYVGMTNDLLRRVYEHKAKAVKGFTEKYNVNKLVYFEETPNVACRHRSREGNQKMAAGKEECLGFQVQPRMERPQ